MSNEQIAEKRALRAKIKMLRAAKRTPQADAALQKNFLSLPEIAGANTFFIYASFGSEADTMPVINALLQRGKTVCLPRVAGPDMLPVRYAQGISLTKNRYGIAEPTGEIYPGRIDVAVLPLLAVDPKGNRLGYGGGYYDRFLTDTPCLKIGYCYDFQVSDKPFSFAEEHDVPLDMVVTDQRIIGIKRN